MHYLVFPANELHLFPEVDAARPIRDGLAVASIPTLDPAQRGLVLTKLHEAMTRGISCGLFPAEPPLAVVFDMDATAVNEETLDEVARAAGKERQVAALTKRAMAGELDFQQSLSMRLRILKGTPLSLLEVVRDRMTLSTGIKDLCHQLKARGTKLFLVSGGFTLFAEAVGRTLGMDGVHAHVMDLKDDKMTGNLACPLVDAAGKKTFVRDTAATLGIDPVRIAVVGDGFNDRMMMEGVGSAIGYQPKPKLIPTLTAANFSGDHTLFAAMLAP